MMNEILIVYRLHPESAIEVLKQIKRRIAVEQELGVKSTFYTHWDKVAHQVFEEVSAHATLA